MSLLIRGATLMTVSERGDFHGDVRIHDGVITEMAERPLILEPTPEDTVLDADGLFITPGLIDPFICMQSEEQDYIVEQALASGVTSVLLWDDQERCTLFHKGTASQSGFLRIDPSRCSEEQFDRKLVDSLDQGLKPVVDVQSENLCRRTLLAVRRTGVKPILFRLSGCSTLTDAIVDSGCAAVPAPFGMCGSSPWQMAVRLKERDVSTALTCAYPYSSMKHLPLCAALCTREGLSADTALKMITSIPASLLGVTDVGSITPGFRADLNIYDGNPLLIASSLVMTICGGKIHRSAINR